MILYFSGTGNSLSAARFLARETGDTAVHVVDLTAHCGTCRGIQDKVIGFVFPVYFGDLPDPVREFAEYTRFAPSTYFYAVATCGSTPGNALYNLQEILERKRCHLSYGRAVPMIANSTATWKKGVTYDLSRLETARKKLVSIATAVRTRTVNTDEVKRSLTGSLMAMQLVRHMGKRRFAISVDIEACTGCGICERLCPMHNITIKNGKARAGDQCVSCMACAHWCPSGGILVHGHAISREDQYHHPDIEVKDLFLR